MYFNKQIKQICDEMFNRQLYSVQPLSPEEFVNEQGQFFTFFCTHNERNFLVKYTFDPDEIELFSNEIDVCKILKHKIDGCVFPRDFIQKENFIALVYENIDYSKFINLDQCIQEMKEKKQEFTYEQLLKIVSNLARLAAQLQESGVLLYFYSLQSFVINTDTQEILLSNLGVSTQAIGRKWFHQSQQTPGGDNMDENIRFSYTIPESLEYLEPEMLSPKMREFQTDPSRIQIISPYNEFTYTLGTFIYQLITLKTEMKGIRDLRQKFNVIGRTHQIGSGFIRLMKELVCEKSYRRISFITLNKIMKYLSLSNKYLTGFGVLEKLNDSLQHDIDHQVEYEHHLQQSKVYNEDKSDESDEEENDGEEKELKYMAKGLWNTKTVVKYKPVKNQYQTFNVNTLIKQGSYTVTVHNYLAFIIGGCDDYSQNIQNQMYSFDIPDDEDEINENDVLQLKQKASMVVRKTAFSVLASEDFIFLLGGKMIFGKDQQLTCTNLCEIYSVESDSWNILPALNVKRADSSSCIFKGRYIYIFGGESDLESNFFQIGESIERFDLVGGQDASWHELELGYVQGPCQFAPRSQAIQISKDQIYIFGGVSLEGMDAKSYKFTVSLEDEYECELQEIDRYDTNIVCDQVVKGEFQIYGISSNASLDLKTKGLKSIVQIDIFEMLQTNTDNI